MTKKIIDSFGREINYLRVSVTDRCDLRCTYCMAEDMTFLPKNEVLSIEEMIRLCDAFIDLGTTKIRITGGEPLVRKNVINLFEHLGKRKKAGDLKEVTLTTNGTQLLKTAQQLKDCGVERINVSLDALTEEGFDSITRSKGKFHQVLDGLKKAKQIGLRVKLNTVALNSINGDSLQDFVKFSMENGYDITFIEVMPMGDLGNEDRLDHYLPLEEVKLRLNKVFNMQKSDYKTGGPSEYFSVEGYENKVGFISPLTNKFCDSCNRVRLTCTGTLYTCLGQDNKIEMLQLARENASFETVQEHILQAIADKPKEHNFAINNDTQVSVDRHMNVTGG